MHGGVVVKRYPCPACGGERRMPVFEYVVCQDCGVLAPVEELLPRRKARTARYSPDAGYKVQAVHGVADVELELA